GFAAGVDHHGLGGFDRGFVIDIEFDQMQAQIEPGVAAAGAENRAVGGHQLFGDQVDAGVAFAEPFRVGPVGGGLASFQQAGFGQEEGAGAVAGDLDAPPCLLPQAVCQFRIALDGFFHVATDRGHQHDLGVADVVKGAVGLQHDVVEAFDGATVAGGETYLEFGGQPFALEEVPGGAGGGQQIDDPDDRGGKGVIKTEDVDVDHGVSHSTRIKA